MKKVVAERKDIVFFIKLFPLPMHKEAYPKSKAIACAHFSLALLNDAMEGKNVPAAKCDTKAIDDTIELGRKLGISGTPALIFPDGRIFPGAISADEIIRNVEKK
jgi:thiol:disulfide interchange protein DsbC